MGSAKADDLSMPAPADMEDRTVVEQAVDFIEELLRDGPVLSTDAEKACKAQGFTVATQRRAKAKLKVQSHRKQDPEGDTNPDGNRNSPWEWHLPPHAQGGTQ